MPLGTSAFLVSEDRLEAPFAKIPWLLVWKLVLGCGEDREKGPKARPQTLPGKVLPTVFTGKRKQGWAQTWQPRGWKFLTWQPKKEGVSPFSFPFLFCG